MAAALTGAGVAASPRELWRRSVKQEGTSHTGPGERTLSVLLKPREVEAEKFAQRAMVAFLEGWDMQREGRSLFYSPSGYSGARLASWRAGWSAARHEQQEQNSAARAWGGHGNHGGDAA